jgi:hypothetical protein
MIKLSPPNIERIKKDFYKRIVEDHGNAEGLATRIKKVMVKQTSISRVRFLHLLLNDVQLSKTGQSIIIADPAYLEQRLEEYQRRFSGIFTEEFLKVIEVECFFYDNYKKWKAYDLAHALGMNTCCYCNRQFTFTYESADGNTRPTFDHFLKKSTYPFFSLSLFNLIPSCKICNSDLKK